MPICLVCGSWGERPLCGRCALGLEPIEPLVIEALTVFGGFRHETTARRLVHLLKYRGLVQAAVPLVMRMAECLPADAPALVPVPRTWVRRTRYGVDPARVLATGLGRRTGIPVVDALRPDVWWPAHAGRSRGSRRRPRFVVIRSVPVDAVLVDDVATTGSTLRAAAGLLGVTRATTATRADRATFDRIEQWKTLNGPSSGAPVQPEAGGGRSKRR